MLRVVADADRGALTMERVRAVRFSDMETKVLLDLIKSYMMVENRRIDCSSKAVKGKTWKYITAEFQSRTASKRSELQLWKKWKNLKHAARKYDAALKSGDELCFRQKKLPRISILEEVLDVIRREREVLVRTTTLFTTAIKEENCDQTEAIENSLSSEDNSDWLQESCNNPPCNVYVNNDIKLCPVEADVTVKPLKATSSTVETEYIIPERIVGSFTRNVMNHDGNSSGDVVLIESEMDCTSNGINLSNNHVEADVIVNTQQTIPTVIETEYIIPTQIAENLKTRNVLNCENEDAISMDGLSSVSCERNYTIGSSIQEETDPLLDVNSNDECSSLSKKILEKELALKSGQLTLLEKVKQIKDLDIKIREEQLTDIMIWRNREQELRELKKRRFELCFNHGSVAQKY